MNWQVESGKLVFELKSLKYFEGEPLMFQKSSTYIILVLLLFIGLLVMNQNKSDHATETGSFIDKIRPSINKDSKYGVSASDPLAVQVGIDILENGGNAVDAAIAVSYALTVVEPFSSGIGGGGNMLIHTGDGDGVVSYQYKETAPLSGRIPRNEMGTPGFVKGMEKVHEDYGTMPLEDLIDPSIRLAREGFKVNKYLSERLSSASYRLSTNRLPHFYPNGRPIKAGKVLKQEALADTLEAIQKEGSKAFYEGKIAEELVDHVGTIKMKDLQSYSVVVSDAVKGTFAGYDVYSSPPPLSGATLIQALSMAESFEWLLKDDQMREADYVHIIGEVLKSTYQDRQRNIADPKFYQSPLETMLSETYIKGLAQEIDLDEISIISNIYDSPAEKKDYDNTTHFVVIDNDGMVVSTTNTLSNFFGSGDYINGFFLNNSMANFSTREASPNVVEGGKRARSFTSPTILVNEEEVIGIGSPGGKRIPSVLTEVLVKNILLGMDMQEAIDSPRFYIEEDDIYMEEGFPEETRKRLEDRGYYINIRNSPSYFGGVQALGINKEKQIIFGGSDSRRNGTWDTGR